MPSPLLNTSPVSPFRQYYTPQRKYDDIQVSTETVNHISESVNYGKPISLDYYVVRCLKCKQECATSNIIDGEQVEGTIKNPEIYLWSARCKSCLKEWYF